MAQSILEMAKGLVKVQVEFGWLPPEGIQKALQEIYVSLMDLKIKEEAGVVGVSPEGKAAPRPLNWKKSITKQTVTCFECGKAFKQLTASHLHHHGLETHSYRAKYGIPRTQGLVAKDVAARRKRIVRKVRPWENAPNYLKTHGVQVEGEKAAPKSRMKKKTTTAAA